MLPTPDPNTETLLAVLSNDRGIRHGGIGDDDDNGDGDDG